MKVYSKYQNVCTRFGLVLYFAVLLISLRVTSLAPKLFYKCSCSGEVTLVDTAKQITWFHMTWWYMTSDHNKTRHNKAWFIHTSWDYRCTGTKWQLYVYTQPHVYIYTKGYAVNWGGTEKRRVVSKRQHYNDVIMCAMASQITSLTIVYSTVHSGADQRKRQSSASLACEWGIHRWAVNSPAQTASKAEFPFDDVIMRLALFHNKYKWYMKYGSIVKRTRDLPEDMNTKTEITNSVVKCVL